MVDKLLRDKQRLDLDQNFPQPIMVDGNDLRQA